MLNAFFQLVEWPTKQNNDDLDNEKAAPQIKKQENQDNLLEYVSQKNDSLFEIMNRKFSFDPAFHNILKSMKNTEISQILKSKESQKRKFKQFLKPLQFFKVIFKMISEESISKLIESIDVEEVTEQTVIFNFKHPSQKAYIMLDGDVLIYLPQTEQMLKRENEEGEKQINPQEIRRSGSKQILRRSGSKQFIPQLDGFVPAKYSQSFEKEYSKPLPPPSPFAREQPPSKIQKEHLKKYENIEEFSPVFCQNYAFQILKPGSMLNEQCLFKETRNSFGVLTQKKSRFLVIDRQIFNEILGEEMGSQRLERVNFLQKVPLFRDMLRSSINEIANQMIEVKYQVGDLVYSELNQADQVFFIKSGDVQIGQNNDNQKSHSWNLEGKQFEQNQMNKGLIFAQKFAGQMFGEVEVVYDILRFTFARSISKELSLYVVESHQLMGVLQRQEAALKQMKKSAAIISKWREQKFTDLKKLFQKEPPPIQRDFTSIFKAKRNIDEQFKNEFMNTPAQTFYQKTEKHQNNLGKTIYTASLQSFDMKIQTPRVYYRNEIKKLNKRQYNSQQTLRANQESPYIPQFLSKFQNIFPEFLYDSESKIDNSYQDGSLQPISQPQGSGHQINPFDLQSKRNSSHYNEFAHQLKDTQKQENERQMSINVTQNHHIMSKKSANSLFYKERQSKSLIQNVPGDRNISAIQESKQNSIANVKNNNDSFGIQDQSIISEEQQIFQNAKILKNLSILKKNSYTQVQSHQNAISQVIVTEEEKQKEIDLADIYERVQNLEPFRNIIQDDEREKQRQIVLKFGSQFYLQQYLPIYNKQGVVQNEVSAIDEQDKRYIEMMKFEKTLRELAQLNEFILKLEIRKNLLRKVRQ